ncbi:hypothetical protein E2C01_065654 [Portunus trituberculatus]|uniref:Uncharacterized protein n=1 Tax=Portunus trituberculatus TaxID=210409 RepID=A0A5B7HQ67_PORTR|nr:hypothetical protein [Portunus trituberculatus]
MLGSADDVNKLAARRSPACPPTMAVTGLPDTQSRQCGCISTADMKHYRHAPPLCDMSGS